MCVCMCELFSVYESLLLIPVFCLTSIHLLTLYFDDYLFIVDIIHFILETVSKITSLYLFTVRYDKFNKLILQGEIPYQGDAPDGCPSGGRVSD